MTDCPKHNVTQFITLWETRRTSFSQQCRQESAHRRRTFCKGRSTLSSPRLSMHPSRARAFLGHPCVCVCLPAVVYNHSLPSLPHQSSLFSVRVVLPIEQMAKPRNGDTWSYVQARAMVRHFAQLNAKCPRLHSAWAKSTGCEVGGTEG